MPRDNPEGYEDNPFYQAIIGRAAPPATQRASGTMMGTMDSILGSRPTNEGYAAAVSGVERGRRFEQEDEATQDALRHEALIEHLGGIYRKHSDKGHSAAMRMVIQDQGFFNAGGKTTESFIELMDKVQKAAFPAPEKPITVAENAALVTPGGEQLYRNDPPATAGEPMELRKIRTTAAVKRLGDLSEDGYKARAEKATLSELATALQNAPEGSPGVAFRNAAAGWGIDFGDKTDLEVVTSIVDRLTPKQRVPGSGATSDAEMKVFKNSIPGLMQSRVGRQKILQGMAAIVDERVRLGEVADDGLFGDQDYKEVLGRLREVPSAFKRETELDSRPSAAQGGARASSRNTGSSADPFGLR